MGASPDVSRTTATCVYRYRSRQDGLPIIQERHFVQHLRQQLGSRSAPCRVWYGWWQGLLEGEKFLGHHVWRKRICPIASWQRWVWRVRSALSTILSSCKWLWTGTRSFAPSATIASFSTKPVRFHALRKTTMPL